MTPGFRFFASIHSKEPSKWNIKYGGILIAAVGFILTRLTVLPAIHLDVSLLQFLAGDVVPLIMGLLITLVGIALTISTYSRNYVNTIAKWCLFGTLGMLIVAGIVITQVALYTGMPPLQGVWPSSLFANTLLAGAIGGILIGIQSATNKVQRKNLAHQSNQAILLNRLLRHEVLNKLAVIQGYTTQLADGKSSNDNQTLQQIYQSSEDVEEVINEISFLTRIHPGTDPSISAVELKSVITSEVDDIRAVFPDADVSISYQSPDHVHVQADEHVKRVFRQLFKNAIQHNTSNDPKLDVIIQSNYRNVEVQINDNGPGLPEDQINILQHGALPAYDDPSTGFGLPLVKMLVSQYNGRIDVSCTSESGTTIAVVLPRSESGKRKLSESFTPNRYGVTPTSLVLAGFAALISGIGMGGVLFLLTNTLPAIGGLYGIQSMGVGWVLHLFHSIIFGLIFIAIVDQIPMDPDQQYIKRYGFFGFAYGLLLWLGAAGIIMPVWLNLVGIPTEIPFLTIPSLLGHSVWGIALGGLYGLLVSQIRVDNSKEYN